MDTFSTDSLFQNHLSEEAAFEISELLNMLALLFDEKYYAQIRRHHNARLNQSNHSVLAVRKNTKEEDDRNPPF